MWNYHGFLCHFIYVALIHNNSYLGALYITERKPATPRADMWTQWDVKKVFLFNRRKQKQALEAGPSASTGWGERKVKGEKRLTKAYFFYSVSLTFHVYTRVSHHEWLWGEEVRKYAPVCSFVLFIASRLWRQAFCTSHVALWNRF